MKTKSDMLEASNQTQLVVQNGDQVMYSAAFITGSESCCRGLKKKTKSYFLGAQKWRLSPICWELQNRIICWLKVETSCATFRLYNRLNGNLQMKTKCYILGTQNQAPLACFGDQI